MDESLLQTKLFIPVMRADTAARASLVPRTRLIEQLDEGLPGKLTLICAPAGFGKTTLVSIWLEHANLPAAWLSLDEDDNDFARFWTYIIAALQTIQPETGASVLDLLQASPPPPSHTLLTPLINDLAEIPDKIILVLDDYHFIETEAIEQALDYFIEHMPPRMHLVMASRVDPNLSLARLRANGQLNELRSTDLRFTPAESAQFLEQMTGLSLTEAEMAALDWRTEGWIAGLQMAALSLRQRETVDAAQFIEDFGGSHRYIMDYLVDEVLQGQPAEVQTFLLYTSILDQLCSPLCEAILGVSEAQGSGRDFAPSPVISGVGSAQALLAYLEHANLFITPLDDHRHWYRYHPLFADLLRQRFQQTYPDQVVTLHLSASQWYEQAGFIDQAVQHALAAQAFGRAATLVEKAAPAMIEHSEFSRLLTWFSVLPQEEIQDRPMLALYYVQAMYITMQFEQASARLEVIEARLAVDKTKRTPEVQGLIAAMRTNQARTTGDFTAMIALSREALTHLPEQAWLPRARIILNLAIAHYLLGEFEPAYQLLTETIAVGKTAQLALNTLSAITLKAQILHAQAALQQALQLCREGLELVVQHGWQDFPAVGYVYVTFGDLLRELNELGQAKEFVEKGMELGRAGGNPFILIIGNVRLAWLRQTQGDVAGSQAAIRAALQLVQQHQIGHFLPIPPPACYQARL